MLYHLLLRQQALGVDRMCLGPPQPYIWYLMLVYSRHLLLLLLLWVDEDHHLGLLLMCHVHGLCNCRWRQPLPECCGHLHALAAKSSWIQQQWLLLLRKGAGAWNGGLRVAGRKLRGSLG